MVINFVCSKPELVAVMLGSISIIFLLHLRPLKQKNGRRYTYDFLKYVLNERE